MKSTKIRNASFYLSVCLYAIYIFLVNWTAAADKTTGADWVSAIFDASANIILLLCCLTILYKFLTDINYYAKKKLYLLIAVSVIAFLAVTVQSISIILPIIIGFVGLGSKNKTTAKVIAVSLSVLLLTSISFYILGLNGGDTISKPLFGDDSYYSVTVPALGMSNPNGVMMIFTGIIIASLYLTNTKRQTRNAAFVFILLTALLSLTTGSTTGLLIGLLSIVLMWLAKYGKKTPVRLQRYVPWMFAIITVLTFFVATVFGPAASLPNPVNDALTTRPYTWNLRIENNSYLNLHGNNDKFFSEASKAGNSAAYALDNMTLYTLVSYGIIVYLIFFYIFYKGSKRLNDSELLVFVFIACLLMLVERMYLYSFVLIFLLKAIIEYKLLEDKSSKRIYHETNK